VAPVREMFAHIGDVREFYVAMVASGKLHDIFELGQGYFARGIERRLNYFKPDLAPSQRTALAHAFAGAFMSLMSWWSATSQVTWAFFCSKAALGRRS
jgi:hypothetical protein